MAETTRRDGDDIDAALRQRLLADEDTTRAGIAAARLPCTEAPPPPPRQQQPRRDEEDEAQDAAAPPPPSRQAYAPEPAMPSPPPPLPRSPSLPPVPSRRTTRLLYASHLLSTWNSRLFEFAAVLLLASAFPGTLLPASAYALARSAAGALLAAPAGRWIDAGDRLAVVRASIVGGRAAVVGSCGLLWAMLREGGGRGGLFALLVAAACAEKVCAMVNLVAVERDWVVVVTEENEDARRALSARMRRIDLFCKLVGPLAISFVAAASERAAIYAMLGLNAASVAVEYVCIAKVYKAVPSLRRRPPPGRPGAAGLLPASSLRFYLRHRAFLPSFSLALLYLTVLSFSGQMVTYLLAAGYTPLHVGLARTASTAFELSATWVAPRVMGRVGAVRGGIWSLSWQMAWLAAGAWWFLSGHGAGAGAGAGAAAAPATGLVVGVALSRVGLWGFDLCAQSIVQDEVDADHRGAFSAAEAAFQNLFELLSHVSTMVFSRPDQFRWPAVLSVAAAYAAGGLYAMFVRRRRGHLFHAPPCVCPKPEA